MTPNRFRQWASIAARWKISAARPQRRKRLAGAQLTHRCSRTPIIGAAIAARYWYLWGALPTERLIAAWNEHQAQRMPMLFSMPRTPSPVHLRSHDLRASRRSCIPPDRPVFLHQQGLDTTIPAGKAMFQMMGGRSKCGYRLFAKAVTA